MELQNGLSHCTVKVLFSSGHTNGRHIRESPHDHCWLEMQKAPEVPKCIHIQHGLRGLPARFCYHDFSFNQYLQRSLDFGANGLQSFWDIENDVDFIVRVLTLRNEHSPLFLRGQTH